MNAWSSRFVTATMVTIARSRPSLRRKVRAFAKLGDSSPRPGPTPGSGGSTTGSVSVVVTITEAIPNSAAATQSA